MRGLFVTGTDTGAGKTFVAAAIAASLAASGKAVSARKPVLSGTGEAATDGTPMDHELLAMATGEDPGAVAPLRFEPAVSPHLAADLAGVSLDIGDIARSTLLGVDASDILIVEGVGGLLVPLDRSGGNVAALASSIGLPLVIAARPGLGTISHTLLTVESAASRSLEVRGIVLGPWPPQPSAIELDNRRTIGELTGLPVATIPPIDEISREALAAAGSGIPAVSWL